MAKNKPVQRVFFEVLQNGEFLDEASRPYGKRASIVLSSTKGALVLPFYPLSHDIEIARIDKKGVHVFLDSSWAGFITSEGRPIRLSATGGENQVYTLGPGDYGSLTKYDLRLLVKVGPEKQEVKVAHDRRFRGKWLALYISNPLEAKILAVAFLLAVIMVGSFVGGLLKRHDSRPRSKVELSPEYNLAFVYPDHLRYLPEALQRNLDRSKPIASAMKYYTSLSEIFLGYPPTERTYVFSETAKLYHSIYRGLDGDIEALEDAQLDINQSIQDNSHAAILMIPTVKGETLSGSMIRLQGKMKTLHQTLQHSLETRRKTTQEFVSDTSYNFEEYRMAGLKGKANSAISQIKPFTLITNEAAMYKEAEDLALLAEIEQGRINRLREPEITIRPSNSEPIGVEPKVSYVSFVPGETFPDNRKLDLITASTFGKEQKEDIQEPVIGKLDRHLVEAVIDRNRFQLQLCFDLALRRNRNLFGKMEYQWTLDSRGKLSNLTLKSSTIEDRTLRRCIQEKISRWQFPRPERGSVEVTYPFSFPPIRG